MWEYKFVFKDDRMADGFFGLIEGLDDIAGFRCSLHKEEHYLDHYFDSEDLCLDGLGMVCRVRKKDEAAVYTLTVKRQALGANREPVYLQTQPLPLDEASFQRLLKGEFPQNYLEIMQVFAEGKALINLLNLAVHRKVISLWDGTLEIARINLDHFEGALPESPQNQRIIGYEVELKSPPGRTLFPEADVLHDYLRNAFNLIPVTKSKAGRLSHIVRKDSVPGPRKIILDMDTGVDDALAILLAMQSPELEVIGITTSSGNIDAEQAARNSVAVLHALFQYCPEVKKRYPAGPPPVAPVKPAPKPEPREQQAAGKATAAKAPPQDASDVHGPDGLGGLSGKEPYKNWFEPAAGDGEQNALDLFKHLLQEEKNEAGSITLITTGPLTNLAEWIEAAPESVKRLREVVSMGGVFFDSGNRSQAAEFNIHADPTSARKVVEFCRQPTSTARYLWREQLPLTLVGLDVTHKVTFRRAILNKAKAYFETPAGQSPQSPEMEQKLSLTRFIEIFTKYYMDFYYRNEGLDGCYLHDPLAVAYVIDPSLCQVEQYHVEVEDRGEFTSGMTVADYRPTRIFKDKMKEVTNVCYKVDARRLEELFLERVLGRLER